MAEIMGQMVTVEKEKRIFWHKNIGERKMLQKDGKFVKVLNRIADLVGLNLLAILFVFRIITIGASNNSCFMDASFA